jgi:hypothetical protein
MTFWLSPNPTRRPYRALAMYEPDRRDDDDFGQQIVLLLVGLLVLAVVAQFVLGNAAGALMDALPIP